MKGQGLLACFLVFLLVGKGRFHSLVARWALGLMLHVLPPGMLWWWFLNSETLMSNECSEVRQTPRGSEGCGQLGACARCPEMHGGMEVA